VIPGPRPIRRVTRLDQIADTHLGGAAKCRQVRSDPSDLAGRIGPHKGPRTGTTLVGERQVTSVAALPMSSRSLTVSP
jgi:hypothetical protein